MHLVAGVEGWLSAREGEALFRCARACRGRGAIVEIGSWKGRSTIVLAAGSKAGSGTVVCAVDPYVGIPSRGLTSSVAEFQANIDAAGVAALVRPYVQHSAEVARAFGEPVELVYIDGAHDHAAVLDDFRHWFPKVIDGGTMAFHDTVGYAGPRRVVRDHVYRSRQFRRVRFADSLTYAEKVARSTAMERAVNECRWWINQAYAVALGGVRRLRCTIGH
ncbi:MAG: class I SAM-dependent methyltransferase [Acidobacteriota bacterium]